MPRRKWMVLSVQPEQESDNPGWYSDLESYPATIQLEIWDETGDNPVIESPFLLNQTDELGLVTIEVSPATVGEENMSKLWPGVYTGRATTVSQPGAINYFNPISHEFQLTVKGQGWNVSAPTITHDFLRSFDQEGIVMREHPVTGEVARAETGAPILLGSLIVENITSILPLEYSASDEYDDPAIDGVEFTISLNDVEVYTREILLPGNRTEDDSVDFAIPLDGWVGQPLNATVVVKSINNATRKFAYLTGLRIADTMPLTNRADADHWDLLSELPAGSLWVNGSAIFNENGDAGDGRYGTIDDQGNLVVNDALNLTVEMYGSYRGAGDVQKVDVDVGNATHPDVVDAIKIYHQDAYLEEPAETLLHFTDILSPVSSKVLNSTFYPSINANETLFRGEQFPNSTVDDSVRWATLDLNGTELASIYMKPLAGNPITLGYYTTYVPFRASLTGSVAVAPSPAGTSVAFNVTMINNLDEGDNFTWSTLLASDPAGTTVNFTLSESMLAQVAEKNCDIIFSAALVEGSGSGAHVHLLDLRMDGWEDLVLTSTGMPEDLRQRMFSTSLLYYFTSNATGNLGVSEHAGTAPDDVRIALSGNITDWLNIRDYSIPFNQSEYEWDNWSQIKDLFKEGEGGNDATYYELHPENNHSMLLWFKFDEQRRNITEPEIVSGLLKFYDGSSPTAIASRTRKITVLVQPYHHVTRQHYWALGGNASISTTLNDDVYLNVNQSDGVEEWLSLTYRKPALEGKDLVIGDWMEQEQVLEPFVGGQPNPAFENVSLLAAAYNYTEPWLGIPADGNITGIPELWDEFSFVPWWVLANWSSASPGWTTGNLVNSHCSVTPDMVAGSGTMAFSTREGIASITAAMEVPAPWQAADWESFSHFGLELTTTNHSVIDEVVIGFEIRLANGSVKYEYFFQGDFDNKTLMNVHEPLNDTVFGAGDVLERIALFVLPFNYTGTYEGYCNMSVALGPLYFEHEENVARVKVTTWNAAANLQQTRTVNIPISAGHDPFFKTFTFGKDNSIVGRLLDVELLTSDQGTLDVQAFTVASVNGTTGERLDTLHDHDFNYQVQNFESISYRLAVPGVEAPHAPWTIDAGSVNTTAYMLWSELHAYDSDFSGSVDFSIELLDIGGSSNFTDGINDMVRIDTDGNFRHELAVMDSTSKSYHAQDGYQVEITSVERHSWFDTDENGVYEKSSVDYMQLVSNPDYSNGSISANASNPGEPWVEREWDYRGKRPTFGYSDAFDYNQDGSDDWIRNCEDLWDDLSVFGTPTYETRVEISRSWDYNETTGEWSPRTTVTKQNDLAEYNVTLRLLTIDGYEDVFLDEAIVMDGVPVVIDSRAFVPTPVRVDPDGCIYFYDSDKDGHHETGFVLTNVTKNRLPVKEAIGVFFDYDMDRKMTLDRFKYNEAMLSDKFFPTYWLSSANTTGYQYIMNKAYDDAWNAFATNFDEAWLLMFLIDIGVQVVSIVAMGLASAFVGTVIGGPVGAFLGFIAGFFAGLAVNLAWFHARSSVDGLIRKAMGENEENGENLIGDADKDKGKQDWDGPNKYYWKGVGAHGVLLHDNGSVDGHDGTILRLPDFSYEQGFLAWHWQSWGGIETAELHDMYYEEYASSVLPSQLDEVSSETGGQLNDTIPVTGADGLPGFILVNTGDVKPANRSDPAVRAADKGIVALASTYKALFHLAMRSSLKILLVQLGLQVIQVTVAVTGSKFILNYKNWFNRAFHKLDQWLEGLGSGNPQAPTEVPDPPKMSLGQWASMVFEEILQELLLESLVTLTLKAFAGGLRPAHLSDDDWDFLLEQIAEVVSELFLPDGPISQLRQQVKVWRTVRTDLPKGSYRQAIRAFKNLDLGTFDHIINELDPGQFLQLVQYASGIRRFRKSGFVNYCFNARQSLVDVSLALREPLGGKTVVIDQGYIIDPDTFTDAHHVATNHRQITTAIRQVVRDNPGISWGDALNHPLVHAAARLDPSTGRTIEAGLLNPTNQQEWTAEDAANLDAGDVIAAGFIPVITDPVPSDTQLFNFLSKSHRSLVLAAEKLNYFIDPYTGVPSRNKYVMVMILLEYQYSESLMEMTPSISVERLGPLILELMKQGDVDIDAFIQELSAIRVSGKVGVQIREQLRRVVTSINGQFAARSNQQDQHIVNREINVAMADSNRREIIEQEVARNTEMQVDPRFMEAGRSPERVSRQELANTIKEDENFVEKVASAYLSISPGHYHPSFIHAAMLQAKYTKKIAELAGNYLDVGKAGFFLAPILELLTAPLATQMANLLNEMMEFDLVAYNALLRQIFKDTSFLADIDHLVSRWDYRFEASSLLVDARLVALDSSGTEIASKRFECKSFNKKTFAGKAVDVAHQLFGQAIAEKIEHPAVSNSHTDWIITNHGTFSLSDFYYFDEFGFLQSYPAPGPYPFGGLRKMTIKGYYPLNLEIPFGIHVFIDRIAAGTVFSGGYLEVQGSYTSIPYARVIESSVNIWWDNSIGSFHLEFDYQLPTSFSKDGRGRLTVADYSGAPTRHIETIISWQVMGQDYSTFNRYHSDVFNDINRHLYELGISPFDD
ncbi:MAG: hypothetical protein ACTSUE_15025 [Promethearchaeota archaeon]